MNASVWALNRRIVHFCHGYSILHVGAVSFRERERRPAEQIINVNALSVSLW